MKLYPFCLLLITTFFSYGGNENWPLGSRQAGMGFTGVTLSDIWSSSHNQAGLAKISVPTIAIYNENKFLLNTTNLNAICFALPTNEAGVFALDLSYFGYEKYNESKIGLAYGMNVGKHLSIGTKIDYLNTHFAEMYGNKGHIVAELGFLAEPIENFFIGGHIFNITRTKLAVYNDERIPSILSVGAGYRFSEKLFMTTEIEKNFTLKMIYKIGLDYRFLDKLYLRSGATTSPNQLSFGFGYYLKKLKIDIAFSYHQVLGFSPHFGIIYHLKLESNSNITNE